MFNFSYNSTSASSKGVAAISRPSIPAPELMMETVEVKGRDGALHINYDCYKEISIVINCNFSVKSESEFANKWREVKRWLTTNMGAKLSFSDDTNYYRVNYVTLSECTRKDALIGTFDATFYCEPYSYYSNGDSIKYVNSGGNIINAYDDCCPYYRINGAGNGDVYKLGDAELKVNGMVDSALNIDTKLLIAYDDSNNIVPIIGNIEDWRIPAGESVTYTGGKRLYFYPHWRSL